MILQWQIFFELTSKDENMYHEKRIHRGKCFGYWLLMRSFAIDESHSRIRTL